MELRYLGIGLLCILLSCTKKADITDFAAPNLETTSTADTTSVTLQCAINGDVRIKSCGFYFGTDSNDLQKYNSDIARDGSFSIKINGLDYSTGYFYKAFIGNGAYEVCTDISTIQTLSLPTIDIPDAVFKAYLVQNFDTDGDGEISYKEASKISKINCSSLESKISSLKGVEAFTNITELNIANHNLSELDLSSNLALIKLYCYGNQIVSLDLTANKSLYTVKCSPMESLKNIYINKNQGYDLSVPDSTTIHYN